MLLLRKSLPASVLIHCPHFIDTETEAQSNLPGVRSFPVMDLGWNLCSAPPPVLLLQLRCIGPNDAAWEAVVCVGDRAGRGNLQLSPVPKCSWIMMVLDVTKKHKKGGGFNGFAQILKMTPIYTSVFQFLYFCI